MVYTFLRRSKKRTFEHFKCNVKDTEQFYWLWNKWFKEMFIHPWWCFTHNKHSRKKNQLLEREWRHNRYIYTKTWMAIQQQAFEHQHWCVCRFMSIFMMVTSVFRLQNVLTSRLRRTYDAVTNIQFLIYYEGVFLGMNKIGRQSHSVVQPIFLLQELKWWFRREWMYG